VARLTAAQAYGYARQAGFGPAAAVVAVAVGLAESGLVTNARGDLALQSGYWGPSVGLMQIRTVKPQTGTGGDRDISRLDDPLQNMLAAYRISNGGRDWSPWTTYTNQAYRRFLGQARAAAGSSSSSSSTGPNSSSSTGPVAAQPVGFDAGSIASRLGQLALAGVLVAAGAGLVILGAYRAVGSPRLPIAALPILAIR